MWCRCGWCDPSSPLPRRRQWCETQKDCNRLRLVDILAKPWQRLTKYSLLLKAILKKTEPPEDQAILRQMVSSHWRRPTLPLSLPRLYRHSPSARGWLLWLFYWIVLFLKVERRLWWDEQHFFFVNCLFFCLVYKIGFGNKISRNFRVLKLFAWIATMPSFLNWFRGYLALNYSSQVL